MNENKHIDRVLKEKLSEIEMTPSADVWARLEKSISVARKEGLIPNPSDKSLNTPQEGTTPLYVPEINIRKPTRRKTSYVYMIASVAAVLLLTLIITTLNVPQKPSLIGEDIEGVEIKDLSDLAIVFDYSKDEEGDIAEKADETLASESVLAKATVVGGSRSAKAIKSEVKALDEGKSDGGSGADAMKEDVIVDVPKDKADSSDDSKVSGKTKSATKSATTDNKKEGTSDTKRRERSVVHTFANAEYNKRSRRQTAPISTSLFAMNIGAGSGNSDQGTKGKMLLSVNHPPRDYIVGEMGLLDGIIQPATYGNLNVSKERHKIPISFGVSVNIGLIDNLSIETGVTYSYLQSEWKLSSGESDVYEVKQKLHYLGIPVWLKYDFLKTNTLKLYGGVGGMLERGISGSKSYKTLFADYPEGGRGNEKVKFKGVQMSVGAHIGVEFKLTDTWGLYAEPGFNYYFKNDQPTNYRTDNSLSFNLRAGIRINL